MVEPAIRTEKQIEALASTCAMRWYVSADLYILQNAMQFAFGGSRTEADMHRLSRLWQCAISLFMHKHSYTTLKRPFVKKFGGSQTIPVGCGKRR
jgi:hypothetical protein